MCGKGYTRKDHVKGHMKKIHGVQTQVQDDDSGQIVDRLKPFGMG